MSELPKDLVEQIAAAVAAKLGTSQPPPKLAFPTIREVFEAYEERRRHERSWGAIRVKIIPAVRRLGDMPANELTPKRWAQHRAARLKEPARKGNPPSVTTLNLELGCTKTMLSWAAADEQGLILVNPLRDAKRDKQKPPRRTWLSEQDLQRLLSARMPRDQGARTMFHAFVLVQADTGLRFNEARRLRRDRLKEIDDDGACVAEIPETKNGKPHVVGLTPRALTALERIPICLGSPYFFANPNNRKLFCRSTMWRWFRMAAESAGLDDIVAEGEIRVRCHDLRRSAASNAHNRGATLLEVQDMLNHSSPDITSQYVQRTQSNAIRIAHLMADGAAKEGRRGPARAAMGPSSTPEKKLNPG